MALFSGLIASAVEARITRFSFSPWQVQFYRTKWGISTAICNRDVDGSAGSFDFQLRLVQGSAFWVIGNRHGDSPQHPGDCTEYTDFKIPVRLGGLPKGRFEIWIDLAEKIAGKWTTVKKIKVDKDWIN